MQKRNTQHNNHIKTRGNRGNMMLLVMVMLVGLCLAVEAVMALVIINLNLETTTSAGESLALEAAIKLNEMDHFGRMNNLVAQSRAGVYLSRQQYEQVQNPRFFSMEPLARHLLEDARWGSELVEQQREQLAITRTNEVTQLVLNDERIRSGKYELGSLEIGDLSNELSNVPNNEIDQPQDCDRSHRFIDRTSALFRGNINAKLPGDDNDLSFRFSTLTAPVNNAAVRAALIKHDNFRSYATLITDGLEAERPSGKFMPCAVRIKLISKDTSLSAGREAIAYAVATTNGAQPSP